MKKTLLIFITLCTAAIGYSQTFTDSNFIEYTIITSTNTVEITGYDFANGGSIVNIPATVDFSSTTYNVTEIGDLAFLGNVTTGEQITSVFIPNSVTFIGNRAFQSNLLTTVTIPDNVTQLTSLCFAENPLLASVVLSNNLTVIPSNSFFSCALTSVIIPNNVTSIQSLAFANNQLTSVTIPSNVTTIGIQGFKGNPLTCVISENATPPTIVTPTGANTSTDTFGGIRSNIDLSIPTGTKGAYVTDTGALWTGFNSVAEGLLGTFVVDNITYQMNATPNNEVTVTGYNTAGGTIVNIPSTVTSGCTDFSVTDIGTNAFFSKNLTSVTIPTSVTNIGSFTFTNNTNLSSATLHNGITSIGQYAFNNCALTSVNIPTSLSVIEPLTFSSNYITSVTIPSNITSIGEFAFLTNSISNLTFASPSGLTVIENGVFYNNNITSLTLPDTITSIGDNAFTTNDLSSLVIPSSVTTIGLGAFSQNDLTNVTIPNSVTSIGDTAFRLNFLSNITIPANVTNIGVRAFYDNPMTEVTSLAPTPPTITTGGTNDTFASNRGTIQLHIPPNTQGVYVTNAGALWTDFMSVTEDALSTSDFELANNIKIITATDAINVVSPNNVRLQTYALYSISGAKITTGSESEIDTASFATGIYILKLDFDKGSVVKKVVIH